MLVPFLLVPLHSEENSQEKDRKGDIQQLRHFKHKGKHKIGCYPKYLLILTTYRVQGWWNVIIITVKYQPDVRNVR